jgi:fructose transport system substrate-binding protein
MIGVGMRTRPGRGTTLAWVAGLGAAALALGACSSSGGTAANNSSSAAAGGKSIKAALILKEFTNPYWISMENTAKTEAAKLGVQLQVSAGNTDDDTTSQINQIDEAIAAGDKGIIIALNGG